MSVLLTDDREIHALNRRWRSIDKPTDVLSWPQEDEEIISPEAPGGAVAAAVLGDVVISVETAARQAAAREWAVEEEVALLLVHGILHLLGHEDKTERGAERMRRVERRILGRPLDKVQ